MRQWFKDLPLPLSALSLGLAALGNLLGSVLPVSKLPLQVLALFGLILLALKFVMVGRPLFKAFDQVLVASSFATYFMASLLLIAGFGLPVWLWFLTFLAYVAYIGFFTSRFASKRQLDLLYPSWFVVYVGFAMVGVTAPTYGQQVIGWLALGFAATCFAVLFPLVVYRTLKLPVAANCRPILAIFAAPLFLLLTAYLSLAEQPSATLVLVILLVAQTIYWLVFLSLPKLIQPGFSPIYAALTFPLVNSALVFRLVLGRLGITNPILTWLSLLELVIATGIVLAVLVGYLKRLFPWRVTLGQSVDSKNGL